MIIVDLYFQAMKKESFCPIPAITQMDGEDW
jgi:hypothetical protein